MNLVERAKNILMTPKSEWEVIKNETASVGELFTKYAMILAAIPVIATFIGQSLIGVNLGFLGSYKIPISNALMYAVLYYILALVGVYVIAFIIDALAPSFGSSKDMIASLKAQSIHQLLHGLLAFFLSFPLFQFWGYLVCTPCT